MEHFGSEASFHQRKTLDNDPQPSSSHQVSGRQSTDHKSKVYHRLEEFITYFVNTFEAKLHIYHLILEGETKKVGKFSDAFSEKVGQVCLGAAGAGIGFLLGSLAEGAKLGAEAGRAIGGKLGSKMGSEHHKKKVINQMDLVNSSQKDKTAFRHLLIEAAFDVFQSFEMQFMRVTTDQGPKKAMQLLAIDAINRAISGKGAVKDISLSEIIIQGESKKEKVYSLSPGFEVQYEYQSNKMKWNTAQLYDKAGVVKESETSPSFYIRKDGKSEPLRYGYRRLLILENWEKLKEKLDYDNIVASKNEQFTAYQYLLSPEDLVEQSKKILQTLNSKDKNLMEERMKEAFAEHKKDIIDRIDDLKKQSTEHHAILKNIENIVNNIKVEEYIRQCEIYWKKTEQEFKKITNFINENQIESRKNFNELNKKQDAYQGENMKGHQKTQEGIAELNRRMDEVNIAQKNEQIIEPIWFCVGHPTPLFTGRKQELNDLHSKIYCNSGKKTVISQMTVISGLGGIGKTELTRQYIKEYGNSCYNDVIWINAESKTDLSNSFTTLAKHKLKINTRDVDDKEKSINVIVEEVYAFFTKRESLFIFDNAENCVDLKEFLPLNSLPEHCKKPYILITSRNREWEKGIEIIDLNKLPLEDAVEFVKKGLLIKNKCDDKVIQNLVNKLQRFPLAIQQAVAYIEDKHVTGEFTIDDYLQEYEKKTKNLLNSKVFMKISNDYAKTTFTTWKITIDKIVSDEDHGALALEILNTIVYLAPDNITREIFLCLAGNDENMLKSAVRLLVKYSMVNGEEKQSVLSIHRLVQEVTRLELKGQNKEEQVLNNVFILLEKNYLHGSYNMEAVYKRRKLLPHLEAFMTHINNLLKEKQTDQENIEKEYLKYLLTWLGNVYDELGNTFQQKELLEKALIINEKHYGPEHFEVALTLGNLGLAYGSLGDPIKQKELLEKALITLLDIENSPVIIVGVFS